MNIKNVWIVVIGKIYIVKNDIRDTKIVEFGGVVDERDKGFDYEDVRNPEPG
jgi:hypothetical protein